MATLLEEERETSMVEKEVFRGELLSPLYIGIKQQKGHNITHAC